MKLIVAALLAGGTLLAADLPNVDSDECAIVSTDIETGDPTFIDPDPAATTLRLIVYCGTSVTSDTGYVSTIRELKYIDVDLEQAEIIVRAASDLLDDDDVYLP